MSQENVEVVKRFVEAWNAGDLDAAVAWIGRDCVATFPPEVPEPGPFVGRDAIRGWAEQFRGAWDTMAIQIAEIQEQADNVICFLHISYRGKRSDIEVDSRDAHVFSIRDGVIVRWRNFNDRAEALEAAGLRE